MLLQQFLQGSILSRWELAKIIIGGWELRRVECWDDWTVEMLQSQLYHLVLHCICTFVNIHDFQTLTLELFVYRTPVSRSARLVLQLVQTLPATHDTSCVRRS